MIDKFYEKYVNSQNLPQLKKMLKNIDKEKFPDQYIYVSQKIDNLINPSKKEELSDLNNINILNQSEYVKHYDELNSKNLKSDEIECNDTNEIPLKLKLFRFYHIFRLIVSPIALIILIIASFNFLSDNLFLDFYESFFLVLVSIFSIYVSIKIVAGIKKRPLNFKSFIMKRLLFLVIFKAIYLLYLLVINNWDVSTIGSSVPFVLDVSFYYYLKNSEEAKAYLVNENV